MCIKPYDDGLIRACKRLEYYIQQQFPYLYSVGIVIYFNKND